jgi:TonB-linked SusC/RagA family outer membrane protein
MNHCLTQLRRVVRRWPLLGLAALTLGLLGGPAAFAQSRLLKGKVVDAKGSGIPGAALRAKGTASGTMTDATGEYALSLPEKGPTTLTVSSVGYAAQDVTVNGESTLTITLSEDTRLLGEVVVTALGIKKEARTIGYTTQDIAGDQLIKAREPNPVNALVGKFAGLTVGASAEMLSKPKLLLRGNSDLLFVVDGVPINSDTWNVSADDIETYTVLKGPNAAALYGFRGQNGAILITTKRGSKDQRKFSVDFNSSTMFDKGFLALPERQSEYGYGNNFRYAYGNKLYDEDGGFRRTNLWGPRFEGQLIPQYNSPVDPATGIRQGTPWLAVGADNFKRFVQTGVISTNNVAVSSSGEKYDLRMSVSNNYQRGIYPNTRLNINNFNLTSGFNFTDRLRLDGSLNVNLQNSPNIPDYSSGPESYVYAFQVYGSSSWDIADMRDYYKGPQGKPGVQQYYAEYGRENNPYFMAYEWLREHRKTDIYGYTRLSYKINDYLNVALRTQVTTWNQLRTEKLPYSMITYKSPDLRQGDYREDRRSLLENNTDLLLTFNKDVVKDLHVNASAGGNIRNFAYNSSWATTDFLIVPGVYAFTNSKNPVRAYSFRSDMRVLSAYATADFTYKNLATLGVTGRFDKLSTLPKENNTYFYPSVALSTVVSDYVNLPKAVSFLKLRTSYANVRGGLTQAEIGTAYRAATGNSISDLLGYGTDLTTSYDGPSYANQNTYSIATNLYNNTPMANLSGTLANKTLKAYTVSSYEFGLDAKFLRNRLSLDVTHFTTVNGPQIFALPIPSSTGFYNENVNGLVTKRDGWEVALTGSVLKNPNGLNWDVLANWSTFKERLKEIYGNETSIYLNGPDHVFSIGDRLDGYYSYDFLRDPQGNVIHAATGQPLTRPAGTANKQLMGYTNPDFVWALNNRFSYRNFTFSFQFDGRVGGVIRDQVYAYAINAGNQMDLVTGAYGDARLKEWQSTANGTKAPTPAYVGEGVVANGPVKFDAQGNISNLSELTFSPNTKAVTVQSYAQGIYNSGIEEPYLVSKTYAKLREVIIGYQLPTAALPKFIRAASVSLVGRNLLYFAQRKDFDLDQYPEGYSAASNSTLRNPGLQSSTLRRFGFNINLTF